MPIKTAEGRLTMVLRMSLRPEGQTPEGAVMGQARCLETGRVQTFASFDELVAVIVSQQTALRAAADTQETTHDV